MGFDAVTRLLIENDDKHLNKIIIEQVRKLDTQSKALRRQEKSPVHELQGEVEKLKSATAQATFDTIAAADKKLASVREQWEAKRDAHPDRELASIRRAENRVNGMSDQQITDLVSLNGATELPELSLSEVNAIRARVRDNETEFEAINGIAKALRADTPWLRENAEAADLSDYRDRLSTLDGGEVLYVNEAEGVSLHVPVDTLVDYHGELDV